MKFALGFNELYSKSRVFLDILSCGELLRAMNQTFLLEIILSSLCVIDADPNLAMHILVKHAQPCFERRDFLFIILSPKRRLYDSFVLPVPSYEEENGGQRIA